MLSGVGGNRRGDVGESSKVEYILTKKTEKHTDHSREVVWG